MARTNAHVVRNALLGAVAGMAGTAAMDLLLYSRYRRQGGTDNVCAWELAEGVTTWDQASAPGQLGQKVERLVLRRDPPDSWARPTTNVVHWATGIGWALQFGVLSGRSRHRRLLGLVLGPAVWLSGYVILPLAKIYKPIWKYDTKTLCDDLSAHMVYGITTSSALAALARRK